MRTPRIRSPLAGLVPATAFVVAAGCSSSSPVEVSSGPEVATLTVTLSASVAEIGDTIVAVLSALDTQGRTIPLPASGLGAPVWTSGDRFVATLVPGSAVGAEAKFAIGGWGDAWVVVRLGGVLGGSALTGLEPFPVITNVIPDTVFTGWGGVLFAIGTGFTDKSVLLVDGVPYSYQYWDWDWTPAGTWVAGDVPASALAEGTHELRVANPGGRTSPPYLLPVLPPS